MKISILSHDLSHNCLGRAYLLAKTLNRRFEVEIIGPELGGGVWEPLKEKFDYKTEKFSKYGKHFPFFLRKLFNLMKKIKGDVIYAVKPKFTSYGIGILKKRFSEKPIVLDIDDWEIGFYLKEGNGGRITDLLLPTPLNLSNPNSSFYTYLLDRYTDIADQVTVSNKFLQNKYGGKLIPHARDKNIFNPKNFDSKKVRDELGIGNKKVVEFFGTPRQHKGIEELIKAIDLIDRNDLLLLLVGFSDTGYSEKLKKLAKHRLGKRVKIMGRQSFSKVPEFLSVADVIAVPQKRSYSTIGQLPVKVIDAMALGKPVVGTKVSDLPEILNDCGLTVEPGSVKDLGKGINYLLENEDLVKKLGTRARNKFLSHYSYDAIEKPLTDIFQKYEK